MKKLFVVTAIAGLVLCIACGDTHEPGRVYMPDMGYSRAYETYAPRDTNFTADPNGWQSNGQTKIFYNNEPVNGSVSREEGYVYHIAKDAVGDSVNYIAAKQTINPVVSLDSSQHKEAERLYLINCGICHGTKLDGNGPLYKDGSGPYPAKPANLSGTDTKYAVMPDGQMFYSVTYGKNLMGSYASQLTPTQRWMIIRYIKNIQASKNTNAAAPTKDSATKAP